MRASRDLVQRDAAWHLFVPVFVTVAYCCSLLTRAVPCRGDASPHRSGTAVSAEIGVRYWQCRTCRDGTVRLGPPRVGCACCTRARPPRAGPAERRLAKRPRMNRPGRSMSPGKVRGDNLIISESEMWQSGARPSLPWRGGMARGNPKTKKPAGKTGGLSCSYAKAATSAAGRSSRSASAGLRPRIRACRRRRSRRRPTACRS